LKQALMYGDRFANLAFFPVEIAENHVHFERVGVEAGCAAQLFDGEIDLVRDEEAQPEDIVRRLARFAPVDPLAIAQLVALPRLADRQPGEERDERREHRRVPVHTVFAGSARYAAMTPSQRSCAFRMVSISSRAAPSPPRALVTKWTRERTSGDASAGVAASPTRLRTPRSSKSSPMYATCSSSRSSASTICS